MAYGSETSSAETAVIYRGQVNRIKEIAKQSGIDNAAKSRARITAIGGLQHKEAEKLLNGTGTDGASLSGELPGEKVKAETEPVVSNDAQNNEQVTIEDANREIAAEFKKDDAKRAANITETPDAIVEKFDDAHTVAVQKDTDRQVAFAARAVTDDAVQSGQTRRASIHEHEHQLQDKGDMKVNLPKTGNATLDKAPLQYKSLRERNAVRAEGGINGHTQEYVDDVAIGDALEKELTAAGENPGLVREAGSRIDAFKEMHEALIRGAVLKKLEEGKAPEFSSN